MFGFFTIENGWISVAKSAKLSKGASEKHALKKHLSLSVAVCDRKHANRK